MAYATVVDIAARHAARGTYTATSIPNATQVVDFIFQAAAQLDQWLLAGGYAAPFDQAIASGIVATGAQILLKRWNVTGAALYVEESAQQPINLGAFASAWCEVKDVILDKTIDIPLPMSGAKAFPRGLGVPGSLGPGGPTPEFQFDRTAPKSTGSWDL